MKQRENYPALYAVRDAGRNRKRFLLLMLLVALCVGGAVFADGLRRFAEPVVSAYSGETLTVGTPEYKASVWASKAAAVGGTMRVSGWVLSWFASYYAASHVLSHGTQSAAVLSALGVRQKTIIRVMLLELLLVLLPAAAFGSLGGTRFLRIWLRRRVLEGGFPAGLSGTHGGFSSFLILSAGILLAAAVPLLVMRLRLGGRSVGVLFREGEKE
ncbi:MAG: hypothetical protein E7576_01190 [Ruminococcaceae bacterium]|nr:hypothetical protein [Oscillospiraceae bacterium]